MYNLTSPREARLFVFLLCSLQTERGHLGENVGVKIEADAYFSKEKAKCLILGQKLTKEAFQNRGPSRWEWQPRAENTSREKDT